MLSPVKDSSYYAPFPWGQLTRAIDHWVTKDRRIITSIPMGGHDHFLTQHHQIGKAVYFRVGLKRSVLRGRDGKTFRIVGRVKLSFVHSNPTDPDKPVCLPLHRLGGIAKPAMHGDGQIEFPPLKSFLDCLQKVGVAVNVFHIGG